MGMKIDNPDSVKLLPYFMREDETDIAFCKAIDNLIKPVGQKVKSLRVWDKVEQLDNEQLDELAWELAIDWWQDTWGHDIKVNTIRTASAIKRKRGTLWAVQKVVENVFTSGAKVIPWYKYDGIPHHFKIKTEAPLTADEQLQIRAMLGFTQMASAFLDGIEFGQEVTTYLYVDSAISGFSIQGSAIAVQY